MSTNLEWTDGLWADPPSICRGAPFWSWNARLDPARLCRQIEQMHAVGMGGFFMHSRYGLKTAYLSDEWFECVSACVDKARELGLKAYLYDEDRWASGSAGGTVTRDNREYGIHLLVAAEGDCCPTGFEGQGGFAVRLGEGRELLGYRALEEGASAEPDEKLVTFSAGVSDVRAWFNDAPYLDVMNAEAVAEFIRLSYQPYADRYAEDFGNAIPAVFTDEPNYGDAVLNFKGRLGTAPWTMELPRQFRTRRGYDLRDHLPELFFPQPGGGFSKVCLDYYRTITELFVENYSGQIGRWCERHGIELTGHYLLEGQLESQQRRIGAAMPHYEHQQWPGIDILTDQRDEIATAKQCTSVADQLERQRVLSETYGCTGWDWPLEGHKFNAGWQYVLGVNFRCPHLSLYSLSGGGKRDYPASIFPQSPWWKYYKVVEDYFGRLSLMLTQGSPVRDVLMIHPMETAWGLAIGGGPARQVQEAFDRLQAGLLDHHWDYDLGDESLLARHAKVVKAGLKVGRMTYRLVVVPPTVTLRATTVKLLERFADSGGAVIFAGRKPDRIDGEPAGEALAELLGKAGSCEADAASLASAVAGRLERRVSIVEGGAETPAAWAMLRKIKGGQLLFVQSQDRSAAHRVRVTVAGREPVVLWDAQTGERRRLAAEAQGDRAAFELDLPASGSALVTLGVRVAKAAAIEAAQNVAVTVEAAGPWAVELAEPNTLPLDVCRWRIGDGAFSEPAPVLLADERIRSHWGLGERNNNGCQPWYLAQTGRFDRTVRGAVEMKFAFHVTDLPGKLELAIERPEDFRISLNGRAIASEPTGWWVDEDFKTVDLTAAVRPGDNELLLAMDYRSDMELEDLHLVGDFGVRQTVPARTFDAYTLVAAPAELSVGSWVGQGLDFYGGAVSYRVKVDPAVRQAVAAGHRVRLALPGVRCTCAALQVGGQTFVLPWAPMAADVTDALAAAGAKVVVEVIGGRKNILGPLHTPWGRSTGPGEFSPHHPRWTDQYLLSDHGLTAAPVFEILEGGA